jgi:translation initiation factor 3 subunit M
MDSVTDSVSVFAEGTFEEQIQELVNYVVRNRSEEERASFIRPFQDALKTEEGKKPIEEDEVRRKKIFSMVLTEVKGLGEGSEKEIEGFFNLLYSHLFSTYPADSPETEKYLTNLLQTISSAPPEHTSIKYRILSNLFNATPRKSCLRLPVYRTLLQIATANDELEVLQLSRATVENWLTEWDITPEAKSDFLKSIVDAFVKSRQLETAYTHTLSYVRSLSPTSPSAQSAAVEAIAMALRLPTVFDFDPLFKLDAVVAVRDNELFSLLQIFLNDGLAEFRRWEESHPAAIQTHDLEKTGLERKIRLLTLASLGFQNVGRDLPYSTIAASLQVESSEVENWVIDSRYPNF